MKITVTNSTGSACEEALLDKDSGVIEYKDGRISHVLFELGFNKTIKVFNEPKKVEPKEEVVTEPKEFKATPSSEQSKKGKKASVK